MFKRISFILFVGVLFNLTLSAQNKKVTPYLGIGMHSGYSISDPYLYPGVRNPLTSYQSQGYSTFGLSLLYMNEKHLGIQVEVNKVTRGWKEAIEGSYTYTRTNDYIEIPFLTHVAFGQKLIRYSFNIGPYMAFHRGFREEFERIDPDAVLPGTDSISYYGMPVNYPTDLGVMIDAAFGFHTNIGVLKIQARYTQGLTDLFEPYPKGYFRVSKVRNLYFALTYYYPIYFAR